MNAVFYARVKTHQGDSLGWLGTRTTVTTSVIQVRNGLGLLAISRHNENKQLLVQLSVSLNCFAVATFSARVRTFARHH